MKLGEEFGVSDEQVRQDRFWVRDLIGESLGDDLIAELALAYRHAMKTVTDPIDKVTLAEKRLHRAQELGLIERAPDRVELTGKEGKPLLSMLDRVRRLSNTDDAEDDPDGG